MNYPFTAEQFIDVIVQYNRAVWPSQMALYALSIMAIYLIFRPTGHSSRMISAYLGFLWMWMGLVYHWLFFTQINSAARLFAAFFVLEGLLLIYFGLIKGRLEFKFERGVPAYAGILLISLGLAIYPAIGYILGHRYPENPTFGLPCPTTIFTFGMLLLASGPLKRLMIIPLAWSVIGFMAAISFGIKEDVLLLIAGILAAGVLISRSNLILERIKKLSGRDAS